MSCAQAHAVSVDVDDKREVRVCDHCLMASCWLYIFPCDRAVQAGTTVRTVAELRELDREHASYWLDPGAQP
jgi:hypothetical protein